MRKKIKVTLVALMSMAIGAIAAGCAGEATPYEVNDKDNYSVSVKFDANGGTFTTNTSIILPLTLNVPNSSVIETFL